MPSSAATPGVIPPQARVGGRTYSQWSAAWWQWQLESPNAPKNPNVDQNPGTKANPEAVDCSAGQSGNVWFLAGTTFAQPYTTAYRSCIVPTGTFLFFPVIDAWADNLNCYPGPPFTSTSQQLAESVQAQIDSIVPGSMSVTVDNVAVAGLEDSTTIYRAAAGGFFYTLPKNNFLSLACPSPPFPAGTTTPAPGAFADGVYIMHTPLSVGVHKLHWTAEISGFSQDVSYTITVTP
jgi:hypothetical protein